MKKCYILFSNNSLNISPSRFGAPFSNSPFPQNRVHLYCPENHSWTTHFTLAAKKGAQKLEEKKAGLSSYKSQATISMHTHF